MQRFFTTGLEQFATRPDVRAIVFEFFVVFTIGMSYCRRWAIPARR